MRTHVSRFAAAGALAFLVGGFVAGTQSRQELLAIPACSCLTGPNDNLNNTVPCLGTGNATNRACSGAGVGEACTMTENATWSPLPTNCIASVNGISGRIVPRPNTTGGTNIFNAQAQQSIPQTRLTTAASGHCTTAGTAFGWDMQIGDDTSIITGCICGGGAAFNTVATSERVCQEL